MGTKADPTHTSPTDVEAGSLAQTARHPRNLEEARAARAEFVSVPNPDGSVSLDIGDAQITIPLIGMCPFCQQKRVPDPKNLHTCARCRKEKILKPKAAPGTPRRPI